MEDIKETGEEAGIKSFPTYSKSPFIAPLIIPKGNKMVQVASDPDTVLVNNKTGEERALYLATKQKVDKQEFRKIYVSMLKETFKLKQPGYRMFCYFLDSSKINDDCVVFRLDKALEYTEYVTKKSIYMGLAELLKFNIIARTEMPNIYYINPAIFFNGNRIVLIKEYYTKAPRVEINGAPSAQDDAGALPPAPPEFDA